MASVKTKASAKTSAKTSAPRSAAQSKKSTGSKSTKTTKDPEYERVKPMDFFRRRSWQDANGIPIGKRWWRQLGRKQQIMSLVPLLLFFGIILVVVIVLITLGALYLVKKRQEILSPLDSRLTTKTALCRQEYIDVEPECLTEDPTQQHMCDVTTVRCHHYQWEYSQGPPPRIRRVERRKGVILRLINSDYAECGNDSDHRSWCMNGVCVPSNVNAEKWYRGVAFPEKESKMVVRDIDDLPCLKAQPGSNSSYKQFVSWYVGRCGKSSCPDHCNKSVCSTSTMVKYGFRVGLYHCDLTFDPVTGARGRICAKNDSYISPLKLFKCHDCDGFEKSHFETGEPASCKPDQCGCELLVNGVRQPLPDGAPCLKPLTGICFMGNCFPIETKSEN